MKNITYTTFTWYNNCFLIIFIIIVSLNKLRSYEKRVFSIICRILFVTTASSNFC